MQYVEQINKDRHSEFTRAVAAELALTGAAERRAFFALHDHHILPHRFAPEERGRRDYVLLRRQWDYGDFKRKAMGGLT